MAAAAKEIATGIVDGTNLLVMDMDSTLITIETIDELADMVWARMDGEDVDEASKAGAPSGAISNFALP